MSAQIIPNGRKRDNQQFYNENHLVDESSNGMRRNCYRIVCCRENLTFLNTKISNVVVAIEESKNLPTISKEELQIAIEAYEKMMEEINNDKAKTKIPLQARFNDKDKRSKRKCPMKSIGNFKNFSGIESQNSKNLTCQRGENNCNKNDGKENFRGEKKRFCKSKEQCYKCHRFGNFAK